MAEGKISLKELLYGKSKKAPPSRGDPTPKDMGGAAPGSQGPGLSDPADQPTEVKIVTIKPKIHNAQNYNLGRLRYVGNASKYVEDPIALMANQVWNYDLEKSDDLVFGYELPISTNEINKKTAEFLDSAIQRMTDEGVVNEKDYSNDYVYLYFIENIRKYLEDKFTVTTIQKVFPKGATSNFSLAMFWINQIFAKNIKISERVLNGSPIPTLVFSNPVFHGPQMVVGKTKALIFASFFFEHLTAGKQEVFIDIVNKYKKSFSKNNNANDVLVEELKKLSKYLFKHLNGKILVNTNNYHLKDFPSSISIQSVVGLNEISNDDIKENEYARLVASKALKKCKDIKSGKDESSLRLFYKEGNDIILNGKLPPDGLGCDKKTTIWPPAKNMLFNHASLKEPRYNKTLPYYNMIDSSVRSVIPKENDIAIVNSVAAGITLAVKETIKQFRTLLALDRLGGITVSPLGNSIPDEAGQKVLTDKTLMFRPNAYTSPFKAESWFNYWSFIGQSNEALDAGIWGPDEYFSNILTLLKYKNFSPRNGMFSAGYILTKSRILDDGTFGIRQRFYISDPQLAPNTFKMGPLMLAPDGAFTFYDSQIKYGEKYAYQLNQLIAFAENKYRYYALNGFEVKEAHDPDLFEFWFSPSPVEHDNKTEEVPISSVFLVAPFVDIPPHATFLEVHPFRGVNNKVDLLFKDISLYENPEKRKIPRIYWQDGWDTARDYYIKNSNPPLHPKFLSIDDVWFKNQPLEKIIVYKIEGKKPTSELDFTEIFQEVNVLDGTRLKEVEIKPNIQYYFATRSVSVTGLKSYLSQIYAVQLVDDGGTVFPLIDVIELEEPPLKRKEKKEFTSMFRIEPALLQQAPNPTKHDVGYLEPSVFMDRAATRPAYKIRVISKKTGRKADFNVLYKLKNSKNHDSLGDISVNKTRKENVLMSYPSPLAKCKQTCLGTFRGCSDECKKDLSTFAVCLSKCGGTLDSCRQNCSKQ